MSIFNRAGVRQISQDTMADLGPGMHPRISIKGGRFTLIDAGGIKYPWPNLTLPVIVVGANPKKSKVYYDGPYDPEGTTPPTCFSDNGIAASMNATRKMARTCAECELGAWGSDTSAMTGKPTKACDDKKKLAVIVIGDQAQLTYELQCPPKSLKNLNKYAAFVGSNSTPDGSRKADVCDIVTSISFMPDDLFVMDFKAEAWIDSVGPDGLLHQEGSPDGGAAIAARIDAIWNSGVIDELVGLNDKPWGGPPQLAAPATLQALPQPAGSQAALTGPYAGPAGASTTQPQRAFTPPQQVIPPDAEPPKSGRGGARAGAGRKPAQEAQGAQRPAPQASFMQQAPAPQQADPGIPDFLRRPAAVNGPAPAGHPAAGGPFGTPSAPPTGIQEAVNAAFSLSTKRDG